MRNVAALLLCLPLAVSAQEDLKGRTPPSSWSKAGYQGLRFGMGPEDVEAELRHSGTMPANAPPLRDSFIGYRPGNPVRWAKLYEYPVKVADHEFCLNVTFFQGRLISVGLEGSSAGWTDEKMRRFEEKFRELLTVKYGKPQSCDPVCRWTVGDLSIRLDVASVHYESVSIHQEFEVYRSQRIRERQVKEAAPL